LCAVRTLSRSKVGVGSIRTKDIRTNRLIKLNIIIMRPSSYCIYATLQSLHDSKLGVPKKVPFFILRRASSSNAKLTPLLKFMGDNPIPPTFTTTSEGDAFLSHVDMTLRPFASSIKPCPAESSFGDATRCLLGVASP
jgi:hypothetical protein